MNQGHNPTLAAPIMARLLDLLGSKWHDESYANDAVASIATFVEDGQYNVNVYLPNSENDSPMDEEFNTFGCTSELDEEYHEFDTEAELVAHLKTNFSATIKN